MFFLFPKWEAGMRTIGKRIFCGHNIIYYIPCILKCKKNSCQNSIHHWIPVNTTHLDVILISDHRLASEFSSVIWERAARIGPKGCMWTLGHPLSVTALYRNTTKPIICTVQISVLGKKLDAEQPDLNSKTVSGLCSLFITLHRSSPCCQNQWLKFSFQKYQHKKKSTSIQHKNYRYMYLGRR